jgi:hypothetical protein
VTETKKISNYFDGKFFRLKFCGEAFLWQAFYISVDHLAMETVAEGCPRLFEDGLLGI